MSVTENVADGTNTTPSVGEKNIFVNGTYVAKNDGYDGYSIVNVETGGSGYPLIDFFVAGDMPEGVTLVSTPNIKTVMYKEFADCTNQNVVNFINNSGATKTSVIPYTTPLMAEYLKDVDEYIENIPYDTYEYQGCITSEMQTQYGIDLIGSYGSSHPSTANITNGLNSYEAILLQGMYYNSSSSEYNTTMMYSPNLNTPYWAGMKDRNSGFNVYVTFISNETMQIKYTSGSSGVMVFGIRKSE